VGDLCHESLRIRDEADQALLDYIGTTPEVEMELRLKFKRLRERLDGLQRLR
jgi:hypothetical protein